jgi:Tol biopolymer transport system component
VQWFERARFELHPENEPPFTVLFGLLGNVLQPRDIPTEPGRIAYIRAFQEDGINATAIETINPDGTDVQRVSTIQHTTTAENWFIIRAFDWSRDGSRFAFTATNKFECFSRGCRQEPYPYVVNTDGTAQQRLTTDTTYFTVSLSPNGERVVAGDTTLDGPVVIMRADGTARQVLTERPGGPDGGIYPVWAPDGMRVAFLSSRDRTLYVVQVDNSEPARPVLTDEQFLNLPRIAWSPDGTQLAVVPDINRARILVLNADGTGVRTLIDQDGSSQVLEWSPDGTRLLYEVGGRLQVRSFDSAEPVTIAEGFTIIDAAVWSPDGRRIAVSGQTRQAGVEDEPVTFIISLDDMHQTTIPGLQPVFSSGLLWRLPE